MSRPDGSEIARGRIYSENFVEITAPDGSWLWLDRIEIGGVFYGYIASAPMVAGVVYSLTNQGDVDDGSDDSRITYSQGASIPFFVRGTPITVEAGERPVERIRPGMRVLTRDNGFQPVIWAGRRVVRHAELVACPRLGPVRIAPGAMGAGTPRAELRVSPQHHMLVAAPMCELLFGASEVLVPAAHLAGRPGIAQLRPSGDVSYHHLLFARHEVIRAEGAWCESLLDADSALQGFGEGAARAAQAILGPGRGQTAARRRLRRWEAEALLGRAPVRPSEAVAV